MRTALLLLLCMAGVSAQDNDPTLAVIHQIKTEASDHSQVMDTLSYLTDAYGPRLTASPEFDEAAKWAMDRLKSYGLSNIHEEAWGPFGRSWSVQSYTIDMVAPRYSHLAASPLAWSRPTKSVSGEVILAPLPEQLSSLSKRAADINDYQTKWRGKLHGKVVCINKPRPVPPREKPLFARYTDAQLADLAKAPQPFAKKKIDLNNLEIPEDAEERRELFRSLPEPAIEQFFHRIEAERNRLNEFLNSEGVLAVLHEDSRAHNALNFAEAAGAQEDSAPLAPPSFVVTEEQYSRMTRLLEKNIPVKVTAELNVNVSEKSKMAKNLVAELPGSSKPDEIVMVGAHFDSWHTGTGATDNGAGSSVMIEVMRILKALNLPLHRTVRLALWSGEEQGLYGSKAYVKAHFADPSTMQLQPEHAKLDAYLNFDNGSGKIRGVYLQGNDAARPLFEKWLTPFHDMGVTTLTLSNTGGTDHLSFDAVGLPGFQFIQDPLDYGTVTHHSNMDTYSHAIPEDLMQACTVIATLVYDIANRDEMFPRKPLPSPEETSVSRVETKPGVPSAPVLQPDAAKPDVARPPGAKARAGQQH